MKIIIFIFMIAFASNLWAIPALQLDIEGGFYVGGTEESTLTNDAVFTLNAFLLKDSFDSNLTYAISIAVVSDHNGIADGTDYGSFMVGNTSYDVDDTLWEIPPDALFDPNLNKDIDLQKHGIFPTEFLQLFVDFENTTTVGSYNVQDDSSGNSGELMYQVDFEIDVTGLFAGFDLHFDLYGYDSDAKKVEVKAPFSHDAGTDEITKVPEPSIIALFGLGLVGLGFARRRQS